MVRINMAAIMTQHDDRYLSYSVLAFVIAAHLAVFFATRLLNRPELPIEPPGLSFVDLGMMGGGSAGSGQVADVEPAPEVPPPPPPPQPKPVEPPKPRETVKPVVRNDTVKPDVIVPREEPKVQPRPVEPPKPIEPIKPQPETPVPPVQNANNNANTEPKPAGRSGGNQQDGNATGGRGEGSGGGSGGGQGNGGGGSGGGGDGTGGGDFVAASHIGGYLNNPRPPYPPQLLDEGVSGSVRLRVMVEANGKPSSVEVLSATHPLFRRSAEETVRNQYTFRAATRGGQPIRHSYTFTIRFNAPR